MSIKGAIEAGLKEFETRDLYKGSFIDPENGESVCAIGSVYMGLGSYTVKTEEGRIYVEVPNEDTEYVALQAWSYLDDRARSAGFNSVPHFNDDPNTTKEDVVLFMQEALHNLEEE